MRKRVRPGWGAPVRRSLALVLAAGTLGLACPARPRGALSDGASLPPDTRARMVDSQFQDPFDGDGRIFDASRMDRSLSAFWWVNSGGCLILQGGRAMTLQNALPEGDPLRKKYLGYNPGATDDGAHPQNIFRLVTRSAWGNSRQEAWFRVRRYHLSADPHRSESNGILLMARYRDVDDLYYAGLRVDGYAVIKKKVKGNYTQLDYRSVFRNSAPWDRGKNPNLLPLDRWLGLRLEVRDASDGSVRLRLYLDREGKGQWELVAEAQDRGGNGEPPLRGEAYAGIRTDFMDVEFDNYRISDIGR